MKTCFHKGYTVLTKFPKYTEVENNYMPGTIKETHTQDHLPSRHNNMKWSQNIKTEAVKPGIETHENKHVQLKHDLCLCAIYSCNGYNKCNLK